MKAPKYLFHRKLRGFHLHSPTLSEKGLNFRQKLLNFAPRLLYFFKPFRSGSLPLGHNRKAPPQLGSTRPQPTQKKMHPVIGRSAFFMEQTQNALAT